MPNLTGSSTITAILNLISNGVPPYSAFVAPAFTVANGLIAQEVVSLAAGFNAITVPTGCKNGVIAVFSSTAGTGTPAIPFNLKGVTGDTGLPAGLGTFQVILWTGATVPATIGITNNYSSAVNVTLYFF